MKQQSKFLIFLLILDIIISSMIGILTMNQFKLTFGPPAFMPRFIDAFKNFGIIFLGAFLINLLYKAFIDHE